MSDSNNSSLPNTLEEALQEIESLRSQLSGSDLKVFSQNRELRVQNTEFKEQIRSLTEQAVSQSFSIRGLEKSEAKLKGELGASQTRVAELEGNVSSLETEIEGLRSQISALETQVTELGGKLEEHRNRELNLSQELETTRLQNDEAVTKLIAEQEELARVRAAEMEEANRRFEAEVQAREEARRKFEEEVRAREEAIRNLEERVEQFKEEFLSQEFAPAALPEPELGAQSGKAYHLLCEKMEGLLGFPGKALVEQVFRLSGVDQESSNPAELEETFEVLQDTASQLVKSSDQQAELAALLESAWKELGIGTSFACSSLKAEAETAAQEAPRTAADEQPESSAQSDKDEPGQEDAPASSEEPEEISPESEAGYVEQTEATADTSEVATTKDAVEESVEEPENSEEAVAEDAVEEVAEEVADDAKDSEESTAVDKGSSELVESSEDQVATSDAESAAEPEETAQKAEAAQATRDDDSSSGEEATLEAAATAESSDEDALDDPSSEEPSDESAGHELSEAEPDAGPSSEPSGEVSPVAESVDEPASELDTESAGETSEAANTEQPDEASDSDERQDTGSSGEPAARGNAGPSDPETARTLLEGGQHAEALVAYTALAESSPDNGSFQLGRLQSLIGMGRFQEAYAIGKSLVGENLGEDHPAYKESMVTTLMGLSSEADNDLARKQYILELALLSESGDQIQAFLDEADEIALRIPREGELSLMQAKHRINQDDVTEYLIEALHSISDRTELFDLMRTNLERYPELKSLSDFMDSLLTSSRAEALEAESSVKDLLGQGEGVEEQLDEVDQGEEALIQVFLEHLIPRSKVDAEVPSEEFDELLVDAEPAAFVGSLRQALRSVDYTVFFDEIEVLSYDGEEQFLLRSSPEPTPTLLFGSELDDVPPEELRFLVLRELFSMYRKHSQLAHISAGLDDARRAKLVKACVEIYDELESKVTDEIKEELDDLLSRAVDEGQNEQFRAELEAFLGRVYQETESDSFIDLGDFLYGGQLNKKWLDSIADGFAAKQTGLVVASFAVCRDQMSEDDFEQLEEEGFGWLYREENLSRYHELRLRLQRLWTTPLKALISESDE